MRGRNKLGSNQHGRHVRCNSLVASISILMDSTGTINVFLLSTIMVRFYLPAGILFSSSFFLLRVTNVRVSKSKIRIISVIGLFESYHTGTR